jgi:hypothetical protein
MSSRMWASAALATLLLVSVVPESGAQAANSGDASRLAIGASPHRSLAAVARTTFDESSWGQASVGAADLVAALNARAPGIIDSRPGEESSKLAEIFTAERARTLLRSLTVPGWGQAVTGHRTSAAVFGLAEVGIWASFTAFRIQEQLRRESFERSAFLLAGIDLNGRDEEFRRIVGSYLSSDQYNQLVVFRDAANLYYDDPAAYRQYIAAHELGAADAWSWRSVDDLLRYRAQRQDMQKAGRRANTALALAVINRLVSSVHAARAHGASARESAPRSWNFEVRPSNPDDATAFQLGVRARF